MESLVCGGVTSGRQNEGLPYGAMEKELRRGAHHGGMGEALQGPAPKKAVLVTTSTVVEIVEVCGKVECQKILAMEGPEKPSEG